MKVLKIRKSFNCSACGMVIHKGSISLQILTDADTYAKRNYYHVHCGRFLLQRIAKQLSKLANATIVGKI